MRWFRELQHYGFIVEVSPAHHGVNGHGKAPHYRLTEEWYLGKAPTRDFLSWDAIPFTEKRKRDAPSFTAKNRIRGDNGVTTLVQTGLPLVPEIIPAAAKAGADGVSMSDHTGGADGVAITSLTTPYADPNLLSAFEAMWSAPPIDIPFKDLKLKRLYLPAAKRPDKRAQAVYLAAWYQIEQQGLRRPRNPSAVPQVTLAYDGARGSQRVTNAAQVVDFSPSEREQKIGRERSDATRPTMATGPIQQPQRTADRRSRRPKGLSPLPALTRDRYSPDGRYDTERPARQLQRTGKNNDDSGCRKVRDERQKS
jgi:hypothetical protein